MTVFCEGIRRNDGHHARAKKVNGLGRWYYSTDLRERVLVAVEAGEPADVVAEAFMVGRSSVYRWMAAARDEGRRTPKPMGGGPKPIIRDEIEATLCRLLEANNHLTLVECRDQLAFPIAICPPTVRT